MTFQTRILLEHLVKYVLIFIIMALAWSPVNTGLTNAIESGKLEAIAVIMGIIALCSLTGYFTFSYTVVAKTIRQRYFGYFCTLLMGISLSVSLLIIYVIASLWVPEMKIIWSGVLGSLYIGTIIYDNFDLLRMGKDVAAINFYETNVNIDDDHILDTTVDYLREGQHLRFSNSLIGKAIMDLGREQKHMELVEGGKWIYENADEEQHTIDHKIINLFKPFKHHKPTIANILTQLEAHQSQHVADQLIAQLLTELDDHFDNK
jgi:hypothetical protein